MLLLPGFVSFVAFVVNRYVVCCGTAGGGAFVSLRPWVGGLEAATTWVLAALRRCAVPIRSGSSVVVGWLWEWHDEALCLNRTRGKILVIRGGAIGDFVLTTPALRALREQFPETRIELLGYPHIAQLAQAAGLVDEVRSIEARALASFFARRGKLEPAMAEYFAGFPLILSYLYDPDLIFQTNIASVSKAQIIVGPHRPREGEARHAAEVFLEPLQKLAVFDADRIPKLRFWNEAKSETVIALHPGSGSETKNWPLPNWLALADRLMTETAARLVVIGGEADGAQLRAFERYAGNPRVTLLFNQPLVEVGKALQGAAGFVGHDSGITHIAAAVGVPVIALWGPSDRMIWQPLGERITLVSSPAGLAKLPVSVVWEQVQTTFRNKLSPI